MGMSAGWLAGDGGVGVHGAENVGTGGADYNSREAERDAPAH